MPPVITLHRRFAKLEPVAKVLVLHLCRKLCRSLSRKIPDPTKAATKVAEKVFSSADFCNSLECAIRGDHATAPPESPAAVVRRIAATIARPANLQPASRAPRGRHKRLRLPFASGGSARSLRWC